MTDENKKAILFIGFLVALLLFLTRKANQTLPAQAPEAETENAFAAPYWWPNGIYPSPTVSFESVVNVYADNPALGGLANQYFPLFGLVGLAVQ